MHPRRLAREGILSALYALELTGETREKVLDDLFERNSYDGESKAFITELYGNIVDNKIWAEQLISDNLDNWKLERVATLDQLIMRIAVNEIYFTDDVPPKVSISEAIEIAKLYSTEDSSSFVNGVLDAIYKSKLANDETA
ncbi:MAG TPA: transcription antitermination factor NusB [Candidatus Marinimicrobia bacterium]|jgi:N utilization substance protein B|nr:transcription antitermination factor NusB [Candidatus Neomarinimicrobiota bacterium]HIM27682.1 transcription antitermination factor NusB [Candidatus Neomarinimicrobiota bacterium]HIN27185.1 transcription antitermination factor NusB [Candidatus Neomarinimicrobiota bacterium]